MLFQESEKAGDCKQEHWSHLLLSVALERPRAELTIAADSPGVATSAPEHGFCWLKPSAIAMPSIPKLSLKVHDWL